MFRLSSVLECPVLVVVLSARVVSDVLPRREGTTLGFFHHVEIIPKWTDWALHTA